MRICIKEAGIRLPLPKLRAVHTLKYVSKKGSARRYASIVEQESHFQKCQLPLQALTCPQRGIVCIARDGRGQPLAHLLLEALQTAAREISIVELI